MADIVVPSTTSALKKLEEQLTCTICLDLYTNPKTLPCLHSFCHRCLEGLLLDSQRDSSFISCPTCCHHTQLPQPAVDDFPAAFHINNLKKVYNLMTKVSGHQQVTCDNCTTTNATGYCKKCDKFLCQKCIDVHKNWAAHTNHKITSLNELAVSTSQLLPEKQEIKCSNHNKHSKIFCRTCEELVCRDCIVRIHRNHDYNVVSDCYSQHRHNLETNLQSVRDNISVVTAILSALPAKENEIKEQGEVIKEEIHVMVEEMIDVLRQSERQLTREVDTVTDSKLQVLSEDKKKSEKRLSELKDCQAFVEQCLKICSQQEVLISTKQMMKRMSQVNHNIKKFNPKEKADVYFIKDSNIVDTLHHIGDIVFFSPTVLQQCKVKKIDRQHITTIKKTVSFPLSIQFSDSSLLTVPLSSLSCNVVPVGTATPTTSIFTTTTHPGVYTIHCSPVTSGRYLVNVRVNGVKIDSTSLAIPFNPYHDNITPIYTIPELNKPYGVAVTDDGHIIVSERNIHCITVLDKDGKKVKSFGENTGGIGNVKFTYPRGVAITADNFILVADNHKIQKISMDGECIKSVGKQGSGPLEFNNPCGITISPITGHIYIADFNNHRIQVLHPDLTFSHTFGTYGSTKGKFNNPRDVAVDKQGLVYVADTGNCRIQMFTPDGQYLFQFGTKGPGFGITIDDNNLVYVTEEHYHDFLLSYSYNVYVYTTKGVYVCYFGSLYCGRGITFDREGCFLYVCDHGNNRLVVY